MTILKGVQKENEMHRKKLTQCTSKTRDTAKPDGTWQLRLTVPSFHAYKYNHFPYNEKGTEHVNYPMRWFVSQCIA